MVPWKGRLSFKQYLPNKPDRFELKLYVLCEGNSGYISRYEVYTGKNYTPNPGADEDEQSQGHSYNVVMGLLKKCDFLNKGYNLYTDNYYTSPRLFQDLHASATNAVVTVRMNRKEMPIAIKNAKLKKGEAIFRQRDSIVALKWKDKRDVAMLSTKHWPTFTITEKRERSTGDLIVIPTCILEYNKYMGGLDRADQLSKYYTITRKCIKWWKKLAMHIINMVVTNAYLLYVKMSPNPVSHYDFRKDLVRELIARHSSRISRKGRRSVGDVERRLTERHFPSLIPAQEGAKNQRPCRKCVVCNRNNGKRHCSPGVVRKRKETRYWCADVKRHFV
ncbi:piggyBac transposable element-derived protein 4-like [Liolophura sinensis]|uniref:piggyBac transposable element-derived protein 4-like n=1 Tax=Liolophura sinensis TaxID=3198878 RepID=UPI0031583703